MGITMGMYPPHHSCGVMASLPRCKVFFREKGDFDVRPTLLVAWLALVVLPESTHNEANRQPTTENGPQPWPATARADGNAPGEQFRRWRDLGRLR